MIYETDYLAHYGVRGQKWGVRRYQNEDGSLTDEGLKRYGYKGDSSGRFNKIGAILKRSGNKVKSSIRKAVSTKKESFINKHKSASSMSDQELRERTNRLQMEANYKRLQNELSGKNQQKRSFGEKHPIIKQIAITTAVSTAANLVSQQLNTKADELLAKRRMTRAQEKGLLDKDLFPFVSSKNAARITSYNKRQEEKTKETSEALSAAKKAYAERYHLASRSGETHHTQRAKVAWDAASKSFSNLSVSKIRNRPKSGQRFMSKAAHEASQAKKTAREELARKTKEFMANSKKQKMSAIQSSAPDAFWRSFVNSKTKGSRKS